MSTHKNNLLLISFMLLGLLLFVVGCPQGEDPAEAMQRRFNEQNAAKSGSPKTTDTAAVQKGAVDEGAAAAGMLADPTANPCGAETAEAEYTGPLVTITIESIENGIPEYTGKGKYNIRLEVQSDEVPPTPSIWVIKAFDEEGTEVGETKKHLTIPSAYPKIIALSGFYCSSQPSGFEIRRTDGEAITIEDSLAGAASNKNPAGQGRSAGGGGGAPPERGAGGGGGDDEEDDSSGDE